jgi:hypothetical protein
MSSRGTIVILVLAVWVLLAPLAMAFVGCAAMGGICDGPCGVSSCAAISTPTLSSAPAPASSFPIAPERHLPANMAADLDHPPKSFLLSP